MKLSDKLGSKFSAVIGEDEIKKGVVKVKNMKTGEEEETAIEKLAEYISQKKA